MAGGNRSDTLIVFVKLGGDQLHLRTENLEGLVYLSQRVPKILFTFQTYPEAEI